MLNGQIKILRNRLLQWRGSGAWGEGNAPLFLARWCSRFFTIDEKSMEKIGRGVVVDLQRSRGRGQNLSFISPRFFSLGHAPGLFRN